MDDNDDSSSVSDHHTGNENSQNLDFQPRIRQKFQTKFLVFGIFLFLFLVSEILGNDPEIGNFSWFHPEYFCKILGQPRNYQNRFKSNIILGATQNSGSNELKLAEIFNIHIKKRIITFS